MPGQINSFILAQRTLAPNVIAIHYRLTQIMSQRGDAQRKTIARAQTKHLCKLIGNRGDSGRVRIRVSLELVGAQTETSEHLYRREVITLDRFNRWHLSCP